VRSEPAKSFVALSVFGSDGLQGSVSASGQVYCHCERLCGRRVM